MTENYGENSVLSTNRLIVRKGKKSGQF